jgi:hypothetical protein
MSTKKKIKKLGLSKVTIKNLTNPEIIDLTKLGAVNGGMEAGTGTCNTTCNFPPSCACND